MRLSFLIDPDTGFPLDQLFSPASCLLECAINTTRLKNVQPSHALYARSLFIRMKTRLVRLVARWSYLPSFPRRPLCRLLTHDYGTGHSQA
jgi:hypothetical protein